MCRADRGTAVTDDNEDDDRMHWWEYPAIVLLVAFVIFAEWVIRLRH